MGTSRRPPSGATLIRAGSLGASKELTPSWHPRGGTISLEPGTVPLGDPVATARTLEVFHLFHPRLLKDINGLQIPCRPEGLDGPLYEVGCFPGLRVGSSRTAATHLHGPLIRSGSWPARTYLFQRTCAWNACRCRLSLPSDRACGRTSSGSIGTRARTAGGEPAPAGR
jgi:hypothetical protein